jgi:hypothetical protein
VRTEEYQRYYTGVTGVTTPLDNILSDLYMYLDAYDRRFYFIFLR